MHKIDSLLWKYDINLIEYIRVHSMEIYIGNDTAALLLRSALYSLPGPNVCCIPTSGPYTSPTVKKHCIIWMGHQHTLTFDILINFEKSVSVLSDFMLSTRKVKSIGCMSGRLVRVCKGIHYFILNRQSEKCLHRLRSTTVCLFTSLSTISTHIHFTIINECISSAWAVLNCGNVAIHWTSTSIKVY